MGLSFVIIVLAGNYFVCMSFNKSFASCCCRTWNVLYSHWSHFTSKSSQSELIPSCAIISWSSWWMLVICLHRTGCSPADVCWLKFAHMWLKRSGLGVSIIEWDWVSMSLVSNLVWPFLDVLFWHLVFLESLWRLQFKKYSALDVYAYSCVSIFHYS